MKSIIGQVFGRWAVLEFSHSDHHRTTYWICRCECGTIKPVQGRQLKNGTTKSCGCFQRELTAKRNYIHGLSRKNIYKIYYAMLNRCYNPKNAEYKNYGARGISVCNRWRKSFPNFAYDVGEIPHGMSLDRINNNGPYSPENCRLATQSEQHNNRRNTRFLEFEGRTQTIKEWSNELGMSKNTILSRLSYGWSVQDTLTRKIDIRCRHNKSL